MHSDSDHSGVYEGISPTRFWWPLAAGLIYSEAMLLALWYGGLRASDDPMMRLVLHPALGLLYGGVYAFALWRRRRAFARKVTWRDDGLTVTWYDGRSRSFSWNELDRIDTGFTNGTLINTTGGSDFALYTYAPQYKTLLAALQDRV
jgi:hypothetical protein